MGRILAIDYGQKRCGVAVTDPLQITPGGLGTHPTHQLLAFVTDYVQRESVERIIIGYPRQMNNEESASMKYIRPFVEKLRKALPSVPIEYQDERFTSTLAQRRGLARSAVSRIKGSSTRSALSLSCRATLRAVMVSGQFTYHSNSIT